MESSTTSAPRFRSNFASNFRGPPAKDGTADVVPQILLPCVIYHIWSKFWFCNMPRRVFVCADPAIAIARSNVAWPLIAVAIVRRTKLSTLATHLLFVVLAGDKGGTAAPASVDLDFDLSLFFRSLTGGGATLSSWLLLLLLFLVMVLNFSRYMGHDDSSSCELGGGGNGNEFISPMRRRVKVSWALVGVPFKRVLNRQSVSTVMSFLLDCWRNLLSNVHMSVPVWNLLV